MPLQSQQSKGKDYLSIMQRARNSAALSAPKPITVRIYHQKYDKWLWCKLFVVPCLGDTILFHYDHVPRFVMDDCMDDWEHFNGHEFIVCKRMVLDADEVCVEVLDQTECIV